MNTTQYHGVNFTDPTNLPNVEELEYNIYSNYVKISSTDRDRTIYPGTAKFKIRLPYEYKDIYSISLAAGILPNLDNISTDAYTYLKIQDMNHIKLSDGDDVFGVMILHTANTTNFYNIDKSSTNNMPRRYLELKPRLAELSIELLHPNKTPINFGTEGSVGPVNEAIQTSFTFEIKTVRKLKKFHNDTKNVYLK